MQNNEYWKCLDLNDLPNEEWRDIKGYEGCFRVSNLGRFKSLERVVNCGKMKRITKEIILVQIHEKDGYLIIGLRRNGKQIQYRSHRLILEAFIDNPDNKPQVNHKNGIKDDNRIENLEWATNSENQKHAYRELISVPKGSKPVLQFSKDGTFIKRYDSAKFASIETGIHRQDINRCCNGKHYSIGGYLWKYEADGYDPPKYINKMIKPVIQMSLSGDIIKEYESVTQAGKENNISPTGISLCCLGKFMTAGGFKWEHKNIENE